MSDKRSGYADFNNRPPASNAFKIGVAVVAVGLIIVLGSFLKRSVKGQGVSPLSGAERQELVSRDTVDGKRLVHPDLGFSLRHPGPLFFASEVALDKLSSRFGDAGTRFYAYAEMKSGHMLYISVSKRPGLDSDAYEDMVDTVADVFTQQASARMGYNTPIETSERVFDHASGRATLHKVLSGGASHVRVGSWKTTFGREAEYVVIVVGVALRRDAFIDVLESVRLRP